MENKIICEVCQSEIHDIVLDLGSQPLCDDLKPIGSIDSCKKYPLEIAFCPRCYTAQQVYQPSKIELFGPNYHFRSGLTGSVLLSMQDFIDACETAFGNLSGKTVIDIGCNDGSLLDYFKDKGCQTLGIEPTDAARDAKHQIINDFFDKDSAEKALAIIGKPDIITFTNVFAHIENLPELLNNLRILMSDHTQLIVQNHYLGSVLEYGQFDTFYHEHPRTYSARSFKYIAESLNCKLNKVEFVSRDGGNIRAFICREGVDCDLPDESAFPLQMLELQQHACEWIEKTRSVIEELVNEFGPLPAKAFPGRATILINLLGLTSDELSAVYEIEGSIKTFKYVPGTKIPILPEAHLFTHKQMSVPIINLAWHISSEVRKNLRNNAFFGEVIDIKPFRKSILL